MNLKKSDIVLAVSLYALGCFDCAITLMGCHLWGIDIWEGNPLMALLLRAGDIYFIAFKVIGGAVTTFLFIRLDFGPKINKALLAGAILYGLLALWNIANFYALYTVRL